ncbi:transcriptional regulator [Parapedobacter defluvii]|uniref:Transcriptional regulator n=1 Tax=Parapedobacter defluvii TaxID=2045106 RepID=A0ABQ1ML18_9SPHI|nr:helix-turn-helix domain-containing protein [Parapedobacter defluvii]GGC42373.1 transcriptional regulator [Parapedobacter defluvii]
MATVEFVTKEDLEQFKRELFAELCRPMYRPQKPKEQKEWLKSYEVRKLLGISPGTLQSLRRKGTLRFSKVGGLMFYRYEDVIEMMNQSKK